MKVAVAIIFDHQQRILITQRPLHATHGGMWEFPGGKLEENELPASALIREIKEEVGLDISGYQFVGEVIHDYGSRLVNLLVFAVTGFEGEALCRESQLDIRWVNQDMLNHYEFPAANQQIIKMIKELVLI